MKNLNNMPTRKNHYYKPGLTYHPLYRLYYGIIGRCTNKNEKCYKHYGGRGIKCEWNKFIDFYNDMAGTYKKGLEIDRIDVNGNYCKENCRWATRKEQMNNYRNNIIIEYEGSKYTLSEFSEKSGINKERLRYRVKAGVSKDKLLLKGIINRRLIGNKLLTDVAKELNIVTKTLRYRIKLYGEKKAISMPVDEFKGRIQPKYYFRYNGENYTIRQLSKKFNLKYDTLRSRLFVRKMPLEKALTKKI